MDRLRDETDQIIDETLKRINVDVLLANPDKALKLIVLNFIKENNNLFKQASNEGIKLAKSL